MKKLQKLLTLSTLFTISFLNPNITKTNAVFYLKENKIREEEKLETTKEDIEQQFIQQQKLEMVREKNEQKLKKIKKYYPLSKNTGFFQVKICKENFIYGIYYYNLLTKETIFLTETYCNDFNFFPLSKTSAIVSYTENEIIEDF